MWRTVACNPIPLQIASCMMRCISGATLQVPRPRAPLIVPLIQLVVPTTSCHPSSMTCHMFNLHVQQFHSILLANINIVKSYILIERLSVQKFSPHLLNSNKK